MLENTGQKKNIKIQTTQKLNTTQRKQTTQNTAKQNILQHSARNYNLESDGYYDMTSSINQL